MIRPLRSRHRRMIAVLALVLPVLLVWGLLARQPVPENAPAAAGPLLPPDFAEVSRSDDAWGGLAVRTIWLRDGSVPPRRAVTLELREDLRRPDLLVYWSEDAGGGNVLPDDATLLGPIADRQTRAWVLPAETAGGGRLILYSLAKHEVVGVAEAP